MFRRKLPAPGDGAPIVPAVPAVEVEVLPPPLDFVDIFDRYMASIAKKWGHDRTKTLGGSEVFGCIRKAYYSRNNTPKDPEYKESWGATRRGDLIENYHVVPAMEYGAKTVPFNLDYAGENQRTLFAPDAPMSVTPDGLLHGLARNALARYGVKDLKSNCCMFEIKSIDPRVDLSEEKSIHHGQTQIQMGLVHETTEFRPYYAVILYVNASFFDDMEVFIVEFDPKKYEVAKVRSRVVYECDDPSKLMREGKVDGSCRYCPYQGACLGTTMAGMPKNETKLKKGQTSAPQLVDALDDLMAKARASRHALKKATKQDGLLKEEIKEVLRAQGERRARDDNWSVSYSMSAGKKTIDTEALGIALSKVQLMLDRAGMAGELDEVLRDLGINEGQNEPRTLDLSTFEKLGNPFEVLRLTYTEADDADV